MTPDAWDECGVCGHDRDDHEDDRNHCGTFVVEHYGVTSRALICPCEAFQDAG